MPIWSPPGPVADDLPLHGDTAVDAYLPWDRLTHQARHRPGNAWPVIVEFPGEPGEAAKALQHWMGHWPPGHRARVKSAFAASLALAEESLIHTALLPDGCEPLLLQAVAEGCLVRFQLGARCTVARPPRTPDADPGDRLGPGPAPHVLGVIDDGCCFAHEHFRSDAGCRVRALWDQSPAAPVTADWQRPAAGGFDYGVEMLQKELDAALARHPGLGEASERRLYDAIGRREWGLPSRTHGARVMHLMAGPDPDGRAGAGAMPVIFVQLPRQTVGDTSGDSLGLHVLDGARYIAKRARQIDPGSKVTINISLGSIAGPHDGTSLAEQGLAELVAGDTDICLVMAAGNTAGPDARVHACQEPRRGRRGTFVVRVPPALQRDSFVELWIEPEAIDRVRLTVRAPGGVSSQAIGSGQVTSLADDKGRVLAALAFVRRPAQGLRGALALLSIAPTEPSGDRAAAPLGFWSVEVEHEHPKPTTVHAWVERDDEVIGARRPQQVRFENPTGAPDDTSVNDEMTLSNLSNADGLVVVGGYVQGPQRVAAYSANGPRRGRDDGGPGYFAPSDRSDWVRGVAVPGFFSGTRSAISGTSAAAPQIARALAEGRTVPLASATAGTGTSDRTTQGRAAAAMRPRPQLRPARPGRPLRPGTRWLP